MFCILSYVLFPGSNMRMTLFHISVPDLSQEKVEQLELYLKAIKLFRNYEDPSEDPVYSEVRTPSNFID